MYGHRQHSTNVLPNTWCVASHWSLSPSARVQSLYSLSLSAQTLSQPLTSDQVGDKLCGRHEITDLQLLAPAKSQYFTLSDLCKWVSESVCVSELVELKREQFDRKIDQIWTQFFFKKKVRPRDLFGGKKGEKNVEFHCPGWEYLNI